MRTDAMGGNEAKRKSEVAFGAMGTTGSIPDANTVEAKTQQASRHFRVPAVDRAMNLFELLASSRSGLTLSELSRKLNMPKSATHYLIYTLATRGYLRRGSDGRHSLGLHFADIVDIANASRAELTFAELATPYLRRVSARFDLTATLTILRGAEALIVGRAISANDGAGGAWVGHHIDLHCTAQGKALIAYLSDRELGMLFGSRELAQFTPKTIVSLSALKIHLADVRANGFSVNDEEHEHGVRAVAAPVFDNLGVVIAAVSVRGSPDQIATSRFRQLGRELIFISRDITQQLSVR